MAQQNESYRLIGDDLYIVSCFKSLSFVDVFSLSELYQPLITNDGVSLFLTLYSEGYHQDNAYNHHRLFTINNMSVHQFSNARSLLEQYGLLETLVKSIGKINQYVYLLKHPKGTQQFLQDSFYARALANTLGQENYALTLSKFDKPAQNYSEYRNITTPLNGDFISKTWDSNKEASFISVNNNEASNRYDKQLFDMEHFLASCTDFQFPYKLRNQEVLDTIYQFATTYHLSEQAIAVGLYRAIRNNQFDANALLKYCLSQSESSKTIDLVNDSPNKVLQYYKQGIALAANEIGILEKLRKDYKFNNEIINAIIAYCIETYHCFDYKQVFNSAAALAYGKVSNGEDAKRILNENKTMQHNRKRNNYVEQIPDYMKNDFKVESEPSDFDFDSLAMFKEGDA